MKIELRRIRSDSEVRNSELVGREAYEAALRAKPTYHDGTPRPSWDQLSDIARWSWSRPVIWRNANGTYSHRHDPQREWTDELSCRTDFRFHNEWRP